MTVRVLESRIHDYLGMAMRYSWAGEGARDFKTQYFNDWFPYIVQGGAEEEKGGKTRMARVDTRLTRHAKWDTYLDLKYNLNSQLKAHVNSKKDRKQLINNSRATVWVDKQKRTEQVKAFRFSRPSHPRSTPRCSSSPWAKSSALW